MVDLLFHRSTPTHLCSHLSSSECHVLPTTFLPIFYLKSGFRTIPVFLLSLDPVTYLKNATTTVRFTRNQNIVIDSVEIQIQILENLLPLLTRLNISKLLQSPFLTYSFFPLEHYGPERTKRSFFFLSNTFTVGTLLVSRIFTSHLLRN